MNLKITAIYPGLVIHLNNIHFRCRAERIVLSVMITDLQPAAVMLLGMLHLISDAEDPWGIVARLMAATPAGSYLTISHPAIDIHPSQSTVQRIYNQNVSTPQTLRTREQVARFFTGLELVEPGLVQVHQWRPDHGDFAPEGVVSAHGGVARKAIA